MAVSLHNHYHDTVLSPNKFQCSNCEKSLVFESGKYQIHHCNVPFILSLHNHCLDTDLSLSLNPSLILVKLLAANKEMQ